MTDYKQHYVTVIMEHYFSETTNALRIIYKNPVQILLIDIFIIEIGSGLLCAT